MGHDRHLGELDEVTVGAVGLRRRGDPRLPVDKVVGDALGAGRLYVQDELVEVHGVARRDDVRGHHLDGEADLAVNHLGLGEQVGRRADVVVAGERREPPSLLQQVPAGEREQRGRGRAAR